MVNLGPWFSEYTQVQHRMHSSCESTSSTKLALRIWSHHMCTSWNKCLRCIPGQCKEGSHDLLKLTLRLGCDVETALLPQFIKEMVDLEGASQITASFHDWMGAITWDAPTISATYSITLQYGDIVKLISKAISITSNLSLQVFVAKHTTRLLIAINMGIQNQLSCVPPGEQAMLGSLILPVTTAWWINPRPLIGNDSMDRPHHTAWKCMIDRSPSLDMSWFNRFGPSVTQPWSNAVASWLMALSKWGYSYSCSADAISGKGQRKVLCIWALAIAIFADHPSLSPSQILVMACPAPTPTCSRGHGQVVPIDTVNLSNPSNPLLPFQSLPYSGPSPVDGDPRLPSLVLPMQARTQVQLKDTRPLTITTWKAHWGQQPRVPTTQAHIQVKPPWI